MQQYDSALACYGEGRLEEAAQLCRSLLEHDGNNTDALNLLGVIYGRLHLADAALHILGRAAALKPSDPAILGNLGNVLRDLRRLAEAEEHFRKVLSLTPGSAEAHNNLANTLRDAGRLEEARQGFRRALELDPRNCRAHTNLGHLLRELGEIAAAEGSYREAIRLDPQHVEAYSGLGVVLLDRGAVKDAESALKRALALKPGYADALNNLAAVYLRIARPDEAVRCYRGALEARPDFAGAHSNLIFALDFLETSTLEEQQQERRRWHERHALKHTAQLAPHANNRDPGRILRIGYVSADFRRHSAYYAFAPVICRHDPAQFRVFCYSDVAREDDATARLRRAAHEWRSTVGVSDEALAGQVRRDAIDILVDLSGHSAGNRLAAFARKPAPVQVSAWGHATGTGLRAIDYLFSDGVAIPQDARSLFAEQVVDLPCALCYEPPGYMPDVSPLPAQGRDQFTFGYVNRLEKLSDRVISLWGRILDASPRARLLIKDKTLNDGILRAQLLERLRQAGGIEPGRALLRGSSPHAQHLGVFHDIDVALDPFPAGGGISTTEALWMGVPVVTLLGATPPSRISASLLGALEMREWIARDDDEYVAIASRAQSDLPRLSRLRRELRHQIGASPHGDLGAYALAVERHYRSMWQRWATSAAS